jgi:hypothetical protein
LDEYKGPVTRSKSKQLSIITSEKSSPEVFPDMQRETNNPKTNIMRRDKEVEEMPQEIKESQDLEIEGG